MTSQRPEYGGYFELETFRGSLFHDEAISLNTGRNALGYLLEARNIQRIALPDYLCDSVAEVCARYGVDVTRYPIDKELRPAEKVSLGDGEWMYVVNYFGQLGVSEVRQLQEDHSRLIVDNTQSFFTPPLPGIDTLYTCRKFFGVADGAFLYTDAALNRELPRDASAESMLHLLGRFERSASDYYADFRESERRLVGRPLARMSFLTENLLRAVEYEAAAQRRRANFAVLHARFRSRNLLTPVADDGPYTYPLLIEQGERVRPQLHRRGVFAALLWPNVVEDVRAGEAACELARTLLPLPLDQRYTESEMEHVADLVEEAIGAE